MVAHVGSGRHSPPDSTERFDDPPLQDADGGSDWEASGVTTTTEPISAGAANLSVGDACDVCPNDPFDDFSAGVDNCPTIFNPNQTDSNSNGTGDACEGISQTLDSPILGQDLRSVPNTIAQHRQQASSRIGAAASLTYRSPGRTDTSIRPAGALVEDINFIYHTTSDDPSNIDSNRDSPPSGGTTPAELHEVLEAWDFDKPFTHPNETTVGNGDTS